MHYDDTPDAILLRNELAAMNEFLGAIDVDLEVSGEEMWTDHHLILGEQAILVPPQPEVWRTFLRGSFEYGGRLYGWWQCLPKVIRDKLLIDGEPVVRLDYCQLHAAMLYAMVGLPLDGDAYSVPGFTREEGKLAFMVAVNATTRRKAIGAIAHHLEMEKPRAETLFDALRDRHAGISKAFGSDAGVTLMRMDSEIMVGCIQACADAGVQMLPVHDETIVPARHKSKSKEIMVETFERKLSPITPCQVS